MVDLQSQYAKIQDTVDARISEVLKSATFINGPEVHNFQKELENYLGVKHVIPCANGTDALQIAMMGLGLQPGDEVIVPAFTYVATAEVIGLLKLNPVMVDVDPQTRNLDLNQVAKAITKNTKAIMPVYLAGLPLDVDALYALALQAQKAVEENKPLSETNSFNF